MVLIPNSELVKAFV